MQVTIDGVPFVLACVSASRIGIAITTHNRADVLKRTIEQHQKHLPAGARDELDTVTERHTGKWWWAWCDNPVCLSR